MEKLSQGDDKPKDGVFLRAVNRRIKKKDTSAIAIRKPSQKIQFGKRTQQPLEEQLFDHELKALAQAKNLPVVKEGGYSDEFVMASLFARKLDIKRTEELLQRNLKWRRENGYEILPTLEDIDKDLILLGFSWIIVGSRTKDGRGIVYAQFAKLVPSQWGDKKIMDWIIWVFSKGILLEGMDWHRIGVIYIDLSGFSWANTAFQQKIMLAIQNNFPLRISAIYLLNPPSYLEAILKLVKVLMKKKLFSRIRVIHLEDLKTIIPENELCTQFGGAHEFETWQYLKIVEEFSPVFEKEDLAARRKRINSGEQKDESKKIPKEKKPKKPKKSPRREDKASLLS